MIYDSLDFYVYHSRKIRENWSRILLDVDVSIATDEYIHEILNDTLERENSGYRFIDDKFVPITDKNEIDSIKEALNNNVRMHLSSALRYLSDKK
ncbi:hypothetical protein ATZ36_11745 [Candidatus Endomicrobiellum trichonymphae]|jgi:hypothetical protein|uniref:HEPN AbiJ-N-terminal domain-containing protein n=1 Tax=Endomicrobium trichonymphae TaxID=1408204 RepID=A0A1E5IF19_ENDTX|nr:hypothetical protein ATZ36_11745 [Candidatus Endomicrobium trichonymphae]